MKTIRLTIDKDNIDPELIEQAAGVVRRGGLVAFPTETVYGLGADACDPDAARSIYAAKGRPSDNPLIVHIWDVSQLYTIASEVPEVGKKLFDAFWPGPMTVIVKKNGRIPRETTGGLDTVAVRMPSHPIARELIKVSGRMIAAPSANSSGRPSPTRADHVWDDLEGRIDMLIDGGDVELGLESTIIDLTEPVPMILRPGFITQEMLENVIGEVQTDPGITSADTATSGLAPKAPGMRYRHYAPKGNLSIIEGPEEEVAAFIEKNCDEQRAAGRRTAVLCRSETRHLYNRANEVIVMGDRGDEEAVAAKLFAVLRQMDEDRVDCIFSESFRGAGVAEAVMNRLMKAAGHQLIRVGS